MRRCIRLGTHLSAFRLIIEKHEIRENDEKIEQYENFWQSAPLKVLNDQNSLTWFESLVVSKVAVTSLLVHAEGRKNKSIYKRTSELIEE